MTNPARPDHKPVPHCCPAINVTRLLNNDRLGKPKFLIFALGNKIKNRRQFAIHLRIVDAYNRCRKAKIKTHLVLIINTPKSMSNRNKSLRLFTLAEANATLPLVRVITKDIIELSTHLLQTRQRLELLEYGPFSQQSKHNCGTKHGGTKHGGTKHGATKPNCSPKQNHGGQQLPPEFYSEELEDIHQSLMAEGVRLNRYIDELMELGVELKGLTEGLVDFPAIHNDEVIWLCWKYGEPEITHWHGFDEGFSGRKRIDPLRFQTEVLAQDVQF
jgi:hypothetical protein